MPAVFSSELNNFSREISRIQRNMDRLFNEMWGGGTAWPGSAVFPETSGWLGTPNYDLSESATHYVMSFDVPGLDRNTIRIEQRNHELAISGMRKQYKEERAATGTAIAVEHAAEQFARIVTLPPNVDSSKIEALYEDGVLRIALTKTEVAHGRMIPLLQEGKPSGFFQKLLARATGHEEPKAEGKFEKEKKSEKAA
jgi:HSP20 family protein